MVLNFPDDVASGPAAKAICAAGYPPDSRKVAAARSARGEHGAHPADGDDAPAHRLCEIQNGNHIETFQDSFQPLVPIAPHAHAAFDPLVAHVGTDAALPHSRCVPKRGEISRSPAQPGHCANLFEP